MNQNENNMLARALSVYLETIWDESDKLTPKDEKRKQEICDEVNLIHQFVLNNNIVLPTYISARF